MEDTKKISQKIIIFKFNQERRKIEVKSNVMIWSCILKIANENEKILSF